MRVLAVIPARWASTRFPGKPLTPIAGKPMVQWCWEAAQAARGVDAVLVATDDRRIANAVAGFGGEAVMTGAHHRSGSDRLAEVVAGTDAEVLLNLQGDEPLVRPDDLDRLAAAMRDDPALAVATLAHPITPAEALNPNRVKVVCDAKSRALYFSRAAIPHGEGARHLQHVGLYAYRRETLLAFPHLPQPSEEVAERLEQLRLLSSGITIRVLETDAVGPGVDAPEDVAAVETLLSERSAAE